MKVQNENNKKEKVKYFIDYAKKYKQNNSLAAKTA